MLRDQSGTRPPSPVSDRTGPHRKEPEGAPQARSAPTALRTRSCNSEHLHTRTNGIYKFLADTAWRRVRPENVTARPNQGRHALRAPFEGK